MLYFENDYCEGAHPAILQKLTETNFEKVSGYGTDPYCASAKKRQRAFHAFFSVIYFMFSVFSAEQRCRRIPQNDEKSGRRYAQFWRGRRNSSFLELFIEPCCNRES